MPMWDNQPNYILISLEKDALSRLVSRIANRYSVRTFPTRGYPSFSYVQQMSSYIRTKLLDKPAIVLYFGDFDPSGIDIERDLSDRLEKYKIICKNANMPVDKRQSVIIVQRIFI